MLRNMHVKTCFLEGVRVPYMYTYIYRLLCIHIYIFEREFQLHAIHAATSRLFRMVHAPEGLVRSVTPVETNYQALSGEPLSCRAALSFEVCGSF